MDQQHSFNPAANAQDRPDPWKNSVPSVLAEVAKSFDALAKAAERFHAAPSARPGA